MTATSYRPATTDTPPRKRARILLWGFVAANLLTVEILFVTDGAGKHPLLTIAKFFGLHAALAMMLQLLLVARVPWLDRRIGMDRLTVWHRWLGFALLWTVVLHASFVVLGYATLYGNPLVGTFFDLAAVPASLLGVLGATIVVAIAAVSIRAIRRRLPYEWWHGIHLTLYLALVLALAHQFLEGTTFTSTTWSTLYWWGMWGLVLTALVAFRVLVPLWRNARHRFRVAAVVPESDHVASIYVTGRDLHRLPARAGQFCLWRFPDHNGWWRANPFSLSAAPDGRFLRLTVKAVGDTSARLRHVPVGSRVFVEGPYGAFTTTQRVRGSTLLIAGGVGITPIRALLEELTGPVTVLYRVRTPADAVLLDEVQALTDARGGQLHLLTGRTASHPSPFAPQRLAALVPDVGERDVYVCGPPAMTEAVLRSLRALGVPRAHIHAERFRLA